jgi:hypothetical protein
VLLTTTLTGNFTKWTRIGMLVVLRERQAGGQKLHSSGVGARNEAHDLSTHTDHGIYWGVPSPCTSSTVVRIA